ncbi:hypothetical protein BpHYR1_041517 [Brachionus plicatilis]|uniref:Uncharacterized protein n=1 Tax=Brachionus plicatilis TaxID=10195 RepID=A0A3M7S428_BRAPC|nr:hypothetical protein BpHYR1_041517 [Brachionus plicatilis]
MFLKETLFVSCLSSTMTVLERLLKQTVNFVEKTVSVLLTKKKTYYYRFSKNNRINHKNDFPKSKFGNSTYVRRKKYVRREQYISTLANIMLLTCCLRTYVLLPRIVYWLAYYCLAIYNNNTTSSEQRISYYRSDDTDVEAKEIETHVYKKTRVVGII